MSAELMLFDFFALLALAGAIAGALFVRDPSRASLALLGTSAALAALFVVLDAELLAGLQLLVSSGALLVLLLVGSTAIAPTDEIRSDGSLMRWLGATAGLGTAALLGASWLGSQPVAVSLEQGARAERVLGRALFGDFALAVIAMGLLLLAATIGALLLARPGERD